MFHAPRPIRPLNPAAPAIYRSAAKENTMGIITFISGVFLIGVPALMLADTLESLKTESKD